MYTFPAVVVPALQAHRTCEHGALAQDACDNWFSLCHIVLSAQMVVFHDLELLLNS